MAARIGSRIVRLEGRCLPGRNTILARGFINSSWKQAPKIGHSFTGTSTFVPRSLGNNKPLLSVRYMASLPPFTKLQMPALSPTMEQGNIIQWHKKEGDKVSAGDVLAEIETDKATMSWESLDDGYVAKILVPEKTEGIKVGTLVAVVVEDKESLEAFKSISADSLKGDEAPKPKAAAPKPQEKKAAPQAPQPAAPQPAAPSAPSQSERVIASPYAKVQANERGVNLKDVQGSGPGGRIVAADVLSFSPSSAQSAPQRAAPQPSIAAAGFTDISLSQIRKVTASRLTLSKQTIPHYYLTVDVNVDKLSKLRKELNDRANGAYKLSVNDFIIKASALALKKVPEVNSQWMDTVIRQFHDVNINVAVNTDNGLFTPVLNNADTLGLASINNQVKTLATKAQDKSLTLDQLAIGTFTISNLGMFGISSFAAVINPPQACILATGGVEKRVVPQDEKEGGGFKVAEYMSATLSCDHRVVDGAVGARWLQHFKKYLEDPITMLL